MSELANRCEEYPRNLESKPINDKAQPVTAKLEPGRSWGACQVRFETKPMRGRPRFWHTPALRKTRPERERPILGQVKNPATAIPDQETRCADGVPDRSAGEESAWTLPYQKNSFPLALLPAHFALITESG
jgi:hypothetical protein